MRRVSVLVDSRLDYLPGPQLVSPASQSGPAQGKRVPCERCRRTGKVLDRGIRKMIPCVLCAGTGWRRRRAGDESWDEYTGARLATNGETRSMTLREIEHELDRLDRCERERQGRTAHLRYQFERARAARDREGSYRELERVLELRRHEQPFLVVATAPGILWVAVRMRGTVHVPEWAEPELAAAREPVVRELAYVYDWSTGEIGKCLGLSREKVQRILKRHRRKSLSAR